MSIIAIWSGGLPARIDRVVSIPASQPPSSQLAEGESALIVDEAVGHDTHYIADTLGEATVAPRPTIPAPPTFSAGVAAMWDDLPEGAVVRFVDADGAPEVTVDATNAIEVSFAAGVWRVEVEAEFPWLPATFEIEVSDGD